MHTDKLEIMLLKSVRIVPKNHGCVPIIISIAPKKSMSLKHIKNVPKIINIVLL